MRRIALPIPLLLATAALAGAAVPQAAAPVALDAPICHAASPPRDGASPPATMAAWAEGAILFDGLGDRTRPVTTAAPEAQRYFDQGLRWLWAFNHDEATRSFAHAAILDPECAMCFWGVALTLGPNYNLGGITTPRRKVASAALSQAEALAPHGTQVEQALIAALAKRYPAEAGPDHAAAEPALTAYAAAMRDVAGRFPDDLDVQTLASEALMTAHAWRLWTPGGEPAPGTLEILAMLERVMARDPTHPGANHYYIHAVEASPDPGRGVAAAERLRGLMPGAGHLEHMPAHIFQRVGRYEDAAEANRRGIAADLAYYTRTPPPDYYASYTAHNYHFLAFSAAMEGRSAEAVGAARGARAAVSDRLLSEDPWLDWWMGEIYAAQVRFGLWRDVLAEPAPDPGLRGLNVIWLWARGTAFAALGQRPQAAAALAALHELTSAASGAETADRDGSNPVYRLASLLLRARIAQANDDLPNAIALLRRAVQVEDALGYAEPPTWFIPTRQVLGAVLLQAFQSAAAAEVYRGDLARNAENGWSLLGLSQALDAQGLTEQAAAARARRAAAWARADVTPSSSAF